MYVLMCPCILHPELRARGITRNSDLDAFGKAIERCRTFGIEVVPLPCPETLYLGKDREPGTFLERLDTAEFTRLLDSLEKEVKEIIGTHGPPLCIVGVNSSPTCGVDTTYYGADQAGPSRRPGRGVFLDRFPKIPAIDVQAFARYRVYLAAPLFSTAERRFNVSLYELVSSHLFQVYLPQEAGEDGCCRDTSSQQEMFARHCEALSRADVVLAVIDGADADSGTSWEMGYAYARAIPVISVRTDFRRAGAHEHVNLMLEQSSRVVRREVEILEALHSPFLLEHQRMNPQQRMPE
ncbi:MAG: nucleoside 2-deoxyribosyltransferase [Methanolinea sp.]|nr:nucleoside 2-deoxyribosyltransferase [Methanolinea sp.]